MVKELKFEWRLFDRNHGYKGGSKGIVALAVIALWRKVITASF